MDNSRCRAFLECAEHGSVTAAADALGYTPSAVSQLVTALEKELGLKLFRRSPKGVSLTAEGEAMVPVIRAYMIREKEIYQTAEELKGIVTGSLTIAAYPSVATSWLPRIVRRYKQDYPGIQINIKESIRSDIIEMFEQNKADLAIFAYSEPMPYEWIPLAEEEIIAAIPEDHPLAGAKSFPIKACEKDDFILGSWGKEREILAIFQHYHVHPKIKYTTYDTPATLALVRMGLGISFVNELSARFWEKHLVKLPLDPPQFIQFGIAIPSRDNMTSAARKFLDYALKYMPEEQKITEI